MSKVFEILKCTALDDLNVNKYLKSGKGKLLKLLVPVVVLVAYLIFMIFVYGNMFYTMLKGVSLTQYFMPIIAMMLTFYALYTGIAKSQSILFNSKDYDALKAMPIGEKTILYAKLLYLLLIEYTSSFLIMIPCIIIVQLYEGFNLISFIVNIGLAFCIPIIPAVIGSLIAIIITYVSTKVRSTNIVKLIGLIVFTLIVMLIPMMLSTGAIQFSKEGLDTFLKMYYPLYIYKEALVGNVVMLITYIALNFAVIGTFVVTLSKIFTIANQKLREIPKKNKYVEKEYKRKNIITTMLFKEMKKYVGIPMYIFNTGFGYVLAILLGIVLIFLNVKDIETFIKIPGIANDMYFFITMGITTLVSMASTTCVSISLEGNNLWIYRSIPVNEKDIFLSKSLLNVIQGVVSTIFTATIAVFKFDFTFPQILIMYALPIASNIFFSIFGLLVNLYKPFLNYTNEVAVIKRSFSVFISTFVPVMLYMFVMPLIMMLPNRDMVVAMMLVVFLVGSMVEYKVLNTVGVKLFRKLGD